MMLAPWRQPTHTPRAETAPSSWLSKCPPLYVVIGGRWVFEGYDFGPGGIYS